MGGSAIDPDTSVGLTFGGQPEVTIPPGVFLVSDPVAFNVTPFQNLAVTIFALEAPQKVTGHPGSRATSYLARGDRAGATGIDLASEDSLAVDRWYFVSALEVFAEADASAIAIIGDSLTDGRGSTTNHNDRWPDVLARRLSERPDARHWVVLNQGVGGGRLLRDGLGVSALGRLDRDVIAQPDRKSTRLNSSHYS